MAAGITYTLRGTNYYFTLEEINALFSQVKAVVDGKLDIRGDTVEGTLRCVNTSVINVPAPESAGDLLRND